MNSKNNGNGARPERLCLDCAMCCNGVLFGDVRLQPGDNPRALQELARSTDEARRASSTKGAAPLRLDRRGAKVPQPCPALKGCRCTIYSDRPVYCRQFKCALLLDLEQGEVSFDEAAKIVSTTRLIAERIKRSLRLLGDTDEHLPLAKRFQRTSARLEEVGLDSESSSIYGRLTLAFHDLNVRLSTSFYPA